jgi:mRNA-degrading endonuclease RelE of RelBE toxin-antitoxin system
MLRIYLDRTIELENPCATRKPFCISCHSHFRTIRPSVKSIVISKHFIKDLKGGGEAESIVGDVLDCSNIDFSELHKFEMDIDGNLLFRAKKGGIHIVYVVDKRMRIIFLRAFKNYSEYEKFLNDRNTIRKTIARA